MDTFLVSLSRENICCSVSVRLSVLVLGLPCGPDNTVPVAHHEKIVHVIAMTQVPCVCESFVTNCGWVGGYTWTVWCVHSLVYFKIVSVTWLL